MNATKGLPAITQPIRLKLSLTDLGNAHRLVHHFGTALRWVGPLGQWFFFDGQRWVSDETGEVMRCAKAAVLAIKGEANLFDDPEKALKWAHTSKSRSHLEAMIALAATEPGVALMPEELDADPWLLNVENGTVDLRTGTLRKHNASDLQTKICRATFDPDATSSEWTEFLDTLTSGDAELKCYLRRAIGCSLSGHENEKALFVLWGEGDTGKTTLLRVIMEVLGDYAVQAERNLLLQRSHEAHPTGIADLFGRRMAVCTEVNREQRFDAALVKQLTGGDRLKARRMRQDFFEFNPTHTLFLACNDVPRFDPTDEAIWNRLRIVPFRNRIPASRQDPHLADRLLEDRAAILAWAIRGCLEWQQEGLGEPASLQRAKEEQRKLADPVFRFVEEGCERDDGWEVEATILYQAFTDFANAQGTATSSQKAFGTRLRLLGVSKGRSSTGRTMYEGIRPLKGLNHSPLSTQESELGLITEDPSEGSETVMEVLHAAR